MMDLHVVHERWGRSSDPSLNGHLHYPNDIDRSFSSRTVCKTNFQGELSTTYVGGG
jgi:hypothetical protein